LYSDEKQNLLIHHRVAAQCVAKGLDTSMHIFELAVNIQHNQLLLLHILVNICTLAK